MDQMSEELELEFLDLTDLEDKERHHVQSVLYSRNPNAAYPQLPWQVSPPTNVDPYLEPSGEVQWNHKQQYETANPGETITYEDETCEAVVEEEGGTASSYVESPANIIPATSVIMVPNYTPGIINMYNSTMYSTPSNELNGSSQEPRRNMNNKTGMKGLQKMGIRHRQPTVDPVEQAMPPHHQIYYSQYPQYPQYFTPTNQLAGAPMSSAQHATGSPLYIPQTMVNPYQAPMFYPPFYSPPLPVNHHVHEPPLELSQENVLVKSEYIEEVPVVSVENSVPYSNNSLTEDNINISNSSDVNNSLNSSSSNNNNNNDYDFSNIKDKVVKSSEIFDSSTENVSSDAAVDEKSVSCMKPSTKGSDDIPQAGLKNVNKVDSVSNCSEPLVISSESSSNCSITVSQTVTSTQSSVSSISDSGIKSLHTTSLQSVQPIVSNKSDSASSDSKISSSTSSVSNGSIASNSSCNNTSVIDTVNTKNISKAKSITPASPANSVSKLEIKPVTSPAATNGPAIETSAPAPKSWAAITAGTGRKLPSSPTVYSVNVEKLTPAEQSPTTTFIKTGPAESAAAGKNRGSQLAPRSQAPRSAAKHRSGAPAKSSKGEAASASNDVYLQKISELLSTYKLDHKVVNLLPRGLNNRSSYCYINATLQALLACPPLYNLLKAISSVVGDSKQKPAESSIPFISSLVSFVDEFSPLPNNVTPRKQKPHPPSAQKHSKNQLVEPDPKTDPAFEPNYIYKMLASLNSDSGGSFNVEGRQEDAEEFLSCLLNGLNDEMVELRKYTEDSGKKSSLSNGDIMVNGDASQQGDHGTEWQRVKAKNKSAIVRDAIVERTLLSDIFRGKLKIEVMRSGGVTSCNIQPFFTLQLDIEKAKSVSEALGMLVNRDQLEGVTCSKTNQEVEAWQKMSLEELPCVLLLHLKCFDFKQQVQSCGKIIKNIDVPIDLELDHKWMSYRKTLNRKYKLFAVVYHEGKEATKGHYIADVFHHGYESWIRYDDSNVKFIDESEFLKPKPPRVPYLLYYKRIDTLITPVNTKSQTVNSSLKNR